MAVSSRVTTFLSGVSLVQEVRGGLENSRSINKYLFPITALQCAISRVFTNQIVQLYSYFIPNNGPLQRFFIKSYKHCEKPLTAIEKTAEVLGKGTQRTILYLPTPYPQAITFVLQDIALAASDAKAVLTFEPKLLQAIDKISLIAQQEIIDFLTAECAKKMQPATPPPRPPPASTPAAAPTGWFEKLIMPITKTINLFWEKIALIQNLFNRHVTAPLKKKAYDGLPKVAETGIKTSISGIRSQVVARREDIEKTAIPKLTNLLMRKAIYLITFAGVNKLMNIGVRWAADAAVRTTFHQSTAEEINNYSEWTILALYNTYLALSIISYTARVSEWKKQRILAQTTTAFIEERVGNPLTAVTENRTIQSLIDKITVTLSTAISATGGLLEIDIQSAVDKFKSRCKTELAQLN